MKRAPTLPAISDALRERIEAYEKVYRKASAGTDGDRIRKGFALILACANEQLKGLRFKKQGPNFRIEGDRHWGIINFQRRNLHEFTINLGVWSQLIDSYRPNPTLQTRGPLEHECHWRQRIGYLLPLQKDFFWNMERPADFRRCLREPADAIVSATKQIEKYMDDAALCELAIKQAKLARLPKHGRIERHDHLGILLRAFRKMSEFDQLERLLLVNFPQPQHPIFTEFERIRTWTPPKHLRS